jgi:hypothetical protein
MDLAEALAEVCSSWMMKLRTVSLVLPMVMLAAGAVAGCKRDYIPNTDVEDNEENRDVIAFCEKYRRAVEKRDASAMLELVSPLYYEDGGNPDASDDMDYAQFKAWLTGQGIDEDGITFQDATAIRHEIRYRRVTFETDRVLVDYTFSASFRVPTPKGDEWKRKVDENRLELVRDEAGELKIVAGM